MLKIIPHRFLHSHLIFFLHHLADFIKTPPMKHNLPQKMHKIFCSHTTTNSNNFPIMILIIIHSFFSYQYNIVLDAIIYHQGLGKDNMIKSNHKFSYN